MHRYCFYKADIPALLCGQNVDITLFQPYEWPKYLTCNPSNPVVGWAMEPSWNLSDQADKLSSLILYHNILSVGQYIIKIDFHLPTRTSI